MTDIQSSLNRFKYLEDARKFALNQAGSEVIKKDGNQYVVEAIEKPNKPGLSDRYAIAKDSLFPEENETNLKDTVKRVPDALKVTDKFTQAQLENQAKASALPVVEFLIDKFDDADLLPDERYEVQDNKVTRSKYDLDRYSEKIKSPEAKGLETVRYAIQMKDTRYLMDLSPFLIDAVIGIEAKDLPLDEFLYIHEHLGNPEAQEAKQIFTNFFGPQATLKATGLTHYSQFVEKLNNPAHRESIKRITELAQYPERYQVNSTEDEYSLVELAQTMKEMPGFKQTPVGVNPKKDQLRQYQNAIRDIQQYQYKFRVRQGMQFNEQGIASHGTDLSYRYKNQIFSLGFSGQNYDFNKGTSGDFGGFSSHVNDAQQRLTLGYSTGAFDVQMGAARNNNGWHVEKPESNSTDRYLARKKDDVIDWAKENPALAAGIIGGGLAAAYLYSAANPDDKIPVSFNMKQTIYEQENWRLKASLAPEVILKGGKLDLGIKETGVGLSGNLGRHSYDVNLVHEFQDTSFGTGEINNRSTYSNLRYGYDTHSVMLDNRYTYSTTLLDSRLAYRKDFIHSADLKTFAMPYVNTQELKYQSAGLTTGLHKQFQHNLSLDFNIGYDLKAGTTGGFVLTKEF